MPFYNSYYLCHISLIDDMYRLSIDYCCACGSKEVKPVFKVLDHSITKESFHIGECVSCAFRFTIDPPLEKDCGHYYQSEDYVSHSDTSKGLINKLYHLVRQWMLSKKSKLIDSFGGDKTILDIGSGTGYFLQFMQKKGYLVKGVEVDDKARSYSIEKFGLDVISPTGLKNYVGDETFDVITLWHVLEHLYEPDQYWKIFDRRLKDNGFLVIALPNYKSLDGHYYQQFWAAYDVPRHLWHFNVHSLQKMAERNGFVVTQKIMMPFDAFYASLLSEKYKKSPFGIIRAFGVGLFSLLKSWFNVDASSSIIYVLQKKR